MVVPAEGPGAGAPVLPARCAGARLCVAGFRRAHALSTTEFTQVNAGVNRVLVKRAGDMLDPREGERVGDLFCGLGNFSLPLATRGAHVIGMEGSEGLVQRARDNARLNGLADRTEFIAYDLYADAEGALRKLGRVDKLLIDPPRDGAMEICKALPDAGAPARIVYVSCSPGTLSRDAGLLVNVKGYRLLAAGVVNMFPHTGHVESIALFTRK